MHLAAFCCSSTYVSYFFHLLTIANWLLLLLLLLQVPFRLTRMMIKAMEVSGIEGNFRTTCEAVLRVLRQHKDSLMVRGTGLWCCIRCRRKLTFAC
jgi:hypothetical protein